MSIDRNVIEVITRQFKLRSDSVHGIKHWQRVEKLGLMLAEKTGADKRVITLFAYLHDSKRENELATYFLTRYNAKDRIEQCYKQE